MIVIHYSQLFIILAAVLFPFPVGCLAELPASSSPSFLPSLLPPLLYSTLSHFTPHIFLLPPLHILQSALELYP